MLHREDWKNTLKFESNFLSLFDPVVIKGGIVGLGRYAALCKLSFGRLRELAETTIVNKN